MFKFLIYIISIRNNFFLLTSETETNIAIIGGQGQLADWPISTCVSRAVTGSE